MRSGVGKAAMIGTLLALVVAAVVVALSVTGVLPELLELGGPQQLLVIVSAPDGEGASVASFGFMLDPALASPLVLDMRDQGPIEGTSARTPRTAFPFGGADVVAEALRGQTGGQTLDWVLVKPEAWKPMIDRSGGLLLTIPADVSTYRDGRLIVLPAGRSKLDGDQVEALVAATDFMSKPQADAVYRELGPALARVVAADSAELEDLVAHGKATSSLSTTQLQRYFGATGR